MKTTLSLLASGLLTCAFLVPSLPVMAHCTTKIFTATGQGSTYAEARKDALRKVKKKIAAYKKKHPGCKVKVQLP